MVRRMASTFSGGDGRSEESLADSSLNSNHLPPSLHLNLSQLRAEFWIHLPTVYFVLGRRLEYSYACQILHARLPPGWQYPFYLLISLRRWTSWPLKHTASMRFSHLHSWFWIPLYPVLLTVIAKMFTFMYLSSCSHLSWYVLYIHPSCCMLTHPQFWLVKQFSTWTSLPGRCIGCRNWRVTPAVSFLRRGHTEAPFDDPDP
jgi:hypothetical protein